MNQCIKILLYNKRRKVMKILSNKDYQRIRRWVYRYGKHLDITRWRYHFENGSKDDVIEALLFYQNEDGGFGHALEIDCWNPNSSPVCTFIAYRILEEIGCVNKDHPIIRGMMDFFEKGEYWTEHGCYWSIPSNNEYPVMPWYRFPNAPWFPNIWPPENYTNGDFIDFVMKYFDKNSEIYNKALKIIDYRISIMSNISTFLTFAKSDIEQEIEINDWIGLINCLQKYNLRTTSECNQLLTQLISAIETNANKSVYENCKKRIEKGERKESEDLDGMVDDALNGIWSEQGLKCDNSDDKINEVTSLGSLWWPITGVIDSLKVLKEYNRLEYTEMVNIMKPKKEYFDEYLAACKESYDNNIKEWMPFHPDDYEKWKEYILVAYNNYEKGENIPAGMPRTYTYWCIENEKFVGEIQLRPYLTEEEAKNWGHVAYAIRYSKWGKGYGTKLLHIAIEKLQEFGVKDIYIACHQSNNASIRVIEKNQGMFINTIVDEEGIKQNVYLIKR
jgi:predicted acetyltransferase